MPSRARDAVLVLLGIHHESAVRLLSRLSDATVDRIGYELLECDLDRIPSDEIETAIRAMLRLLVDDGESDSKGKKGRKARAAAAPAARVAQVLTAQECQFLGTLLIEEKVEICAMILTCLPLPAIVRILLSMKRPQRANILRRYRALHEPPEELRQRVVADFVQRIPKRPFPALAKRFEAVVQLPAEA